MGGRETERKHTSHVESTRWQSLPRAEEVAVRSDPSPAFIAPHPLSCCGTTGSDSSDPNKEMPWEAGRLF